MRIEKYALITLFVVSFLFIIVALFLIVYLFFSMSSSTSTTTTTISSVANLVTSSVGAAMVTDNVHSAPSEPIFLQTKLAQGVAGVFVWAALFVTCTQVSCLSQIFTGERKTDLTSNKKFSVRISMIKITSK